MTVPMMESDNQPPVADEKEIRAWYTFDWANSVYNNVAIGIFLPIFLLEIAKTSAGCYEDGYNEDEDDDDEDDDEDDKCGLYAESGSIRMRPSAFALNVISVSVFFQAISFITISPLADYGNLRKRLLVIFSTLGSFFTMLFITAVNPDHWLYAGALTIFSNVCFGCAVVFYNSYLPLLVRSHPEYIACAPEEKAECQEKLTNLISTRGFMAGYIGPLFLLIVCVIILLTDRSLQGLRITLFLSGLWWFIFSIPTILYLKPRPGEPFPENVNKLTFGWQRVYKTIRQARKIPSTFRFMLAYMIYADGYNTIGSVGVLFGIEELDMTMDGLLILAFIVPLSAAVGNYFFLRLQKRKGYNSKQMINIHLMVYLFLPIYGIIGFVAPFGLVTITELYIFGFVYGFNVGSVQSFSRSLFSELIPPGMESEFFGLYEITDKGSSWIGPLLVALILQMTNSMRWGMFILFLFFLIPMLILRPLDVRKGQEEIAAYIESLRLEGDNKPKYIKAQVLESNVTPPKTASEAFLDEERP